MNRKTVLADVKIIYNSLGYFFMYSYYKLIYMCILIICIFDKNMNKWTYFTNLNRKKKLWKGNVK